MRLYVTPASPWVRRVRVAILELGIEDRFEFVPTKWSHKWATQAVEHRPDFLEATPVVRIPALVTADFTLTDSHSICDYINGELGGVSELRGAEAVAANFKGKAQLARPVLVDGALGVVVAPQGRLLLVLNLTFAGDRIAAIDVVADPDRLETLDLSTLP